MAENEKIYTTPKDWLLGAQQGGAPHKLDDDPYRRMLGIRDGAGVSHLVSMIHLHPSKWTEEGIPHLLDLVSNLDERRAFVEKLAELDLAKS